MTRPLPHFADLRDGGNLPRRERLGIRWLALAAALSIAFTTFLIIADKAIRAFPEFPCGSC